jgi:hypothetical protein
VDEMERREETEKKNEEEWKKNSNNRSKNLLNSNKVLGADLKAKCGIYYSTCLWDINVA